MEFTAAYASMALSTLLTVAIFSFLFRENRVFRLAEHIMIGTFTGHTLLMAIKNIRETGIDKVLSGNTILIIPLLLGILLFTRYSRKYLWIARYPLAVIIGVTAGVTARSEFQGQIWRQLQATVSSPLNNLNAIVIFVALLATISYFTFTIKHTGVVGGWTRFGKNLVLFSFGATAAMEVLTRIGEVTSRVEWLITKTPDVTVIATLVFIAWVVYELYIKNKKS